MRRPLRLPASPAARRWEAPPSMRFIPGRSLKQYTILTTTTGRPAPSVRWSTPTCLRAFRRRWPMTTQCLLNVAMNLGAGIGAAGGLNANQQAVANAVTNFFDTTGGIPMVFGTLDAGGPDAGLGGNRDRIAADHLRCDEAVHGHDDRSLHRRPRRRVGPGGSAPALLAKRCQRLCRRRDAAPRERDAYAMFTQGAAGAKLRSALERVGRRLRRIADDRRQYGAWVEQHDQQHLRHCGRRRLSLLAEHASPALRWPAAAPVSASPTAGSGRSDLFQAGVFIRAHLRAGLYLRRAGLWLAGHHHRSHRDHCRHRQSARRVQCQCLLRPRSRAAIVLSALD